MSVNDTVREWLDKQWEASGPKTDWSEVQWDKYHAQLGLLICFVDDCWPKEVVPPPHYNKP